MRIIKLINIGLIFAALVLLSFCAGLASGAEPVQQTAIFGGPVSGAPWWIILAIVFAPGGAAVAMVIGCVWLVRRVNRDVLKRPEMNTLTLIIWTGAIGAVYGPLIQWGFQQVASDLTGLRIYWELVAIAPFITGPASMFIYEFLLMPYLKRKRRGLYETLKVRHRSSRGHVGDTPPDDDEKTQRNPSQSEQAGT